MFGKLVLEILDLRFRVVILPFQHVKAVVQLACKLDSANWLVQGGFLCSVINLQWLSL